MKTTLFLIVAIVLLCQMAMIFGQEKCKDVTGNPNTCERYGDFTKYCFRVRANNEDPTYTCKDKTEIKIGNSLGTSHDGQPTGRCVLDETKGKKSFQINNRCLQIAATGCDATTVGTDTSCSNLATRRTENGATTCVANTASSTNPPLTDGGECGNSTTLFQCGTNLVCNSLRLCEPASRVGQACGGPYSGCVNGAVCHNRICIHQGSLLDNAPCTTNTQCSSGWCDTNVGVCKPKSVEACFFNYECASGSICVDASESKQGRCVSHSNLLPKLQACQAERCYQPYGSSEFDKDCLEKNCLTELTAAICQQKCPLPEDRRFSLDYEYTFNCEEKTATAWSTLETVDRCGVTTQFTGCDKAGYLWDN